jgi:hypothetical protein
MLTNGYSKTPIKISTALYWNFRWIFLNMLQVLTHLLDSFCILYNRIFQFNPLQIVLVRQ